MTDKELTDAMKMVDQIPVRKETKDKDFPELTKVERIIPGVGGKRFPDAYNWVCLVCYTENRSWADSCQECGIRIRS